MNESNPQDGFEQFLKHQRCIPAVPGEWRAGILDAASRALENETASVPKKSPAFTWSALLWPTPWAWAGIGCAWAIALGMNALSGLPGSSSPGLATIPQNPEVVYTMLIEQRRLVRESLAIPGVSGKPAREPAPASTQPPGALHERRRQRQTTPA